MIKPFRRRWNYLTRAFTNVKALLGGGSIAVIIAGIADYYFPGAITGRIYELIIFLCVVIALFENGFKYYRRIEPKLFIPPVVYRQIDKVQGDIWIQYYFEVRNESEASTINHVKVRVEKIEPPVPNLDWLPVPLVIKHDWEYRQPDFILNPLERKHIDLAVGWTGKSHITLLHQIENINKDIPVGAYKITVVAGGENVPPFSRVFRIFTDPHGKLQCVPETNKKEDSKQ
jgi:hypothetical protein